MTFTLLQGNDGQCCGYSSVARFAASNMAPGMLNGDQQAPSITANIKGQRYSHFRSKTRKRER